MFNETVAESMLGLVDVQEAISGTPDTVDETRERQSLTGDG